MSDLLLFAQVAWERWEGPILTVGLCVWGFLCLLIGGQW